MKTYIETFTGELAQAKKNAAVLIENLEARGVFVEMIELRENNVTVTWKE